MSVAAILCSLARTTISLQMKALGDLLMPFMTTPEKWKKVPPSSRLFLPAAILFLHRLR